MKIGSGFIQMNVEKFEIPKELEGFADDLTLINRTRASPRLFQQLGSKTFWCHTDRPPMVGNSVYRNVSFAYT